MCGKHEFRWPYSPAKTLADFCFERHGGPDALTVLVRFVSGNEPCAAARHVAAVDGSQKGCAMSCAAPPEGMKSRAPCSSRLRQLDVRRHEPSASFVGWMCSKCSMYCPITNRCVLPLVHSFERRDALAAVGLKTREEPPRSLARRAPRPAQSGAPRDSPARRTAWL